MSEISTAAEPERPTEPAELRAALLKFLRLVADAAVRHARRPADDGDAAPRDDGRPRGRRPRNPAAGG